MKKLKANFQDRSYDIFYQLGLIDKTGTLIKPLKTDKKVVIVSEANIKKLFGSKLEKSLKQSGFKFSWVLLRGGQEKTLAEIERLYHLFAKQNLSRHSVVISLGGGSVQDLACFAAATFKRGLKLVQIPTTLLISSDVSIGGCAVDLPEGKSLVGTFYQPVLVIQDVALLKGLPDIIYRDGLAEIIKYSINAGFFDQLEKDFVKLIKRDLKVVEKYVYLSNKIKKELTEQDERDCHDIRIQVDLGHTISHALEAIMNYKISHGQALGIGLRGAVLLSEMSGGLSKTKRERVEKLIVDSGLPYTLPKGVTYAELIKHIKKDKKCYGNKLVFILIKDFGLLTITHKVHENMVKKVIDLIK